MFYFRVADKVFFYRTTMIFHSLSVSNKLIKQIQNIATARESKILAFLGSPRLERICT